MAFPASLTLVTVTIQVDLPPTGGATGWIDFTAPYPLQGSSVVAPFTQRAYLTAAGAGTIQLPATNDPQWSPTGWAYAVTGRIGTTAIKGTLQLDHQSTTANFAALFQPDGAAVTGQTYLLTSQRSVAGGVAALDVDGDVTNASGAKITGGGGGGASPSGTVTSGTAFGASATAGVATAYSRGDHSHGTPASPTLASIGAAAASHTHPAAQISDSTATGRSVVTAADAAAARTAIGAGTSNLALGTTSSTAAAGDHLHTGVYDPAGTASTAVSAHTAAADPHPQYAVIYYWNGTSYDIVNGAAVYVGGTGPASPVNGDVWFP
ncbi:hypothetical protein GCM10010168_86010 [Actinoplanes ianthinogenes]|uniref:Uncharacterized protein n=1 Tax=Actinoplanes ianthinogenes TaxID=122358 RepID=A0ABN6CK29_9ACTN|nr:hypothetical protein [Actinoplanes ianthinogenes]BCJ45332.1 hypothetical protein Aiant_59890 [Actinoplanes ianthinogenes]GGR53830.1 hypothetical protein GCM10010168_86010 [Actinoplanes ianthinogenes]